MSSSSSNNVESQLDSDIYFIPDYIMEVEDDAFEDSAASPTHGEEEQWPDVQPYQDEPIADPAWIVQYNEETRRRREKRAAYISLKWNYPHIRLVGQIHTYKCWHESSTIIRIPVLIYNQYILFL